ncbi:riboflavin synthase [Parvibium lacunae]|uniref:Riboflavin synthase n=1 Tax=Parvibium lacunae TaxID=1888893 RepID=A0A368L4P2_9BURK|nr:riboflavin synthase [Parvibium lacunae]RCS58544.1 riboflavin synthase [Parvibium lacunae]
MFTGIVAAVGKIMAIEALPPKATPEGVESANPAGVRLRIAAGGLDLSDVQLGDSIAINGACMTVVAYDADTFAVDVSAESLRCTVGLDQLHEVNLEKAIRLQDRLGGHLVTGHVDGIGRVLHYAPVHESWHLVIWVPQALSAYVAYKGSLTVNGVSLTINQVDDDWESSTPGSRCHINLIPHTVAVTTLRDLQVGAAVNLEIDLIARYVARMQAVAAR